MNNLEPCREGHRRPVRGRSRLQRVAGGGGELADVQGAWCWRAMQTTALRYISEAVGVKSFERATTELRALAEALKTTERKLQIAEQRVATQEASLTRQQNLRKHGGLLRAIDIPAGGAATNHSYKKVFMQCCGAEREATLREPYFNANYQVQNLRQFVCELEQHSQVWKLNIVTHLRSESQVDQLKRRAPNTAVQSSVL